MTNIVLPTQEIGSIRRPDWLLNVLKSPRFTEEQKEAAKDDAAYINLKLLEDTGLDIVYDGEARRVEMYEYAVKHIGGFEFCGRVRSWDNKYFKKARCVEPVSYKGPYHLEEFMFVSKHASRRVKIPITGPYTLADWSFNEYYTGKADLVLDLAKRVLNPLLKDLAAKGAKRIQLDEPAATSHKDEVPLFVEAFNKAVRGVESKVTAHVCYSGDGYSSLFSHAANMKTSQLALEFANRDTWDGGVNDRRGYEPLKLFKEYGNGQEVGLGVIDVHSDRIEPPELVRDRILYASKILGGSIALYVNPDCGLRTRSRQVAFSKLRSMVEGADLARRILR